METETKPYTPRIGDYVVFSAMFARPKDRGVTYIVKTIGPVNIVIEPVGGGQGVRLKPWMVERASDDAVKAAETVAGTEPYLALLHTGQVVTVAGPGWRQPAGEFYVVTKDKGDKVAIVKLGGQGGRYWPGIPRKFLTVVEGTFVPTS